MLAVGVISAGYSGIAGAVQWRFDDGVRLTWNTTISAGAEWRAQSPSNELYSAANGVLVGKPDGRAGATVDSSDLNYAKGDRFSTPFRIISDVEISKGDLGAVLRGKAWYDEALEQSDVRYGSEANAYNGTRFGQQLYGYGPPPTKAQPLPSPWPHETLTDKGFPGLNKFSNVYLLDAYVYDTFKVGDTHLNVRLGNQVVNWGESLFIQGINQINPIDLTATHYPATEVKEVLLPVWMAYANWGFGAGSLEAFYQLEWKNTNIEGCGVYWAVAEAQVGVNPGRCLAVANLGGNSPTAQSTGAYFLQTNAQDPKNSGQGGLAFRFPVEKIDTEFGLYAMNIHARTPVVSALAGTLPTQNIVLPGPGPVAARTIYNTTTKLWTVPGVPQLTTINPAAIHAYLASLAGVAVTPARGFYEYPENLKLYGVSAATTLAGVSVAAELSYQPKQPAQLNGPDIVDAMVGGRGPLAARAVAVTAQGATGYFQGYDTFHKTQFQFNGLKTYPNVLGASNLSLAGEAAFQWNNVPNYNTPGSPRYGRAFVYGRGPSEQLAIQANNPSLAFDLCTAAAAPFKNPQPDGCRLDGYITDFAFGYRLRARLDYESVFGSGIRVSPSLNWLDDVKGVSIDGQFNEGRQILGMGLSFNYAKRYTLDLNYTWIADTAYNPLMDRDYYAVNFSVTF